MNTHIAIGSAIVTMRQLLKYTPEESRIAHRRVASTMITIRTTPVSAMMRLPFFLLSSEPVLVDITNLYDRARYSGRELHKEDVAAMERLL